MTWIPPPIPPIGSNQNPRDGSYEVFDISDEFLIKEGFSREQISKLRTAHGLGLRPEASGLKSIPSIYNLDRILANKKITKQGFYKAVVALMNKFRNQANAHDFTQAQRLALMRTLGVLIITALKAKSHNPSSVEILDDFTKICCNTIAVIGELDEETNPQQTLSGLIKRYQASIQEQSVNSELGRFLSSIRKFYTVAEEGKQILTKLYPHQNPETELLPGQTTIDHARLERHIAAGITVARDQIRESDIEAASKQALATIKGIEDQPRADQYEELLRSKIQESAKTSFLYVDPLTGKTANPETRQKILETIIDAAGVKTIGIEAVPFVDFLQQRLIQDLNLKKRSVKNLLNDFFSRGQKKIFWNYLDSRFGSARLEESKSIRMFRQYDEFAIFDTLKKIQLKYNLDVEYFTKPSVNLGIRPEGWKVKTGHFNMATNRFMVDKRSSPQLLIISPASAPDFYLADEEYRDQIFMLNDSLISKSTIDEAGNLGNDCKNRFFYSLAQDYVGSIAGIDLSNPRLQSDFYEFDQKRLFEPYHESEMRCFSGREFEGKALPPEFKSTYFDDLTPYNESQYFDFKIIEASED